MYSTFQIFWDTHHSNPIKDLMTQTMAFTTNKEPGKATANLLLPIDTIDMIDTIDSINEVYYSYPIPLQIIHIQIL